MFAGVLLFGVLQVNEIPTVEVEVEVVSPKTT